jgi:hypothetical protein
MHLFPQVGPVILIPKRSLASKPKVDWKLKISTQTRPPLKATTLHLITTAKQYTKQPRLRAFKNATPASVPVGACESHDGSDSPARGSFKKCLTQRSDIRFSPGLITLLSPPRSKPDCRSVFRNVPSSNASQRW